MTQDLDFCDTSFTELAAIVAEHLKQWSIDVVVGGLAVEICANNLYLIKDIHMVNTNYRAPSKIFLWPHCSQSPRVVIS